MVMPRSRSSSMSSRNCADISRAETAPVASRMRSASVDFPWSMWAMIEKLRMWMGSRIGRIYGSRAPFASEAVRSRRPPRPLASGGSAPAAVVRMPAPRAATPPAASRPSPRCLVDLRPEGVEVDGQARAAGSAHAATTRRERDGVAAVAPQLEDLQAAKLRVDDPVVPDSRARVVAELLDAVAPHVSGARRGDLHREGRRHADERVREGRQTPREVDGGD